MHAQTAMIENGFVHLPKLAAWLAEYLHELTVFPKGQHDDQVNSTAQMLDWFKRAGQEPQDWMWIQYKRAQAGGPQTTRPDPLSVLTKRLGILRRLYPLTWEGAAIGRTGTALSIGLMTAGTALVFVGLYAGR